MVVIHILDLYEIGSTSLLRVVAWIIHLYKSVSLNISGLEHWDIREEKKEEKELAVKEARIPNLYKLTVVARVQSTCQLGSLSDSEGSNAQIWWKLCNSRLLERGAFCIASWEETTVELGMWESCSHQKPKPLHRSVNIDSDKHILLEQLGRPEV